MAAAGELISLVFRFSLNDLLEFISCLESSISWTARLFTSHILKLLLDYSGSENKLILNQKYVVTMMHADTDPKIILYLLCTSSYPLSIIQYLLYIIHYPLHDINYELSSSIIHYT